MGMAKVLIQIGIGENGKLSLEAPTLVPEQIVFLMEKIKMELIASVEMKGPEHKVVTVPAGVAANLPNLRER